MPVNQKALFVGVNKYNGYASPLDAPEAEVDNWRQLLEDVYGFYDITTLKGPQATRGAVETELYRLLKGAEADDQLVFLFAGHGRVVPAHDDDDRYRSEEALILWPEDGDKNLDRAELTDSDLVRIFSEARPSKNTDITLIADCCWSGNLDVPIPDAKPLFVPAKIKFRRDMSTVREFGSLYRMPEFVAERPIVVAACGRLETALEVEQDGERRLLFSWGAIKYLTQYQDTFYGLKAGAGKLIEYANQHPDLRGNTTRAGERFAGEASGGTTTAASRGAAAAALPSSAVASVKTIGASSPNLLEVRIQGICCYADPRRESDPYQKRLLLPYDDRIDPEKRHIAFVEICEDDLDHWTGALTPIGPYDHYGVPTPKYYRWELTGHRIRFANADTTTSKRLDVSASYGTHVPGMRYAVEPRVTYHPKDECFSDAPSKVLVTAYADLNCGLLTIGDLERKRTKFVKANGTPTTTWKERTPKWTVLNIPTKDAIAVIQLMPYGGGQPTTIWVKAGGSLLIGNERETDIIEEHKPLENPVENYLLYYYLSGAQPPYDPGLPATEGVPINACSNNNWP